MLDYIVKNIFTYFIPLAVTSTIMLIASASIRVGKRIVFITNLSLLFIVVVFSFLTRPPQVPLEAEWALYALRENQGGEYKLSNLLGQAGSPAFLGLDGPDKLKAVPVVYSGEGAQMRVKSNQKGYAYVFHFDTTSAEVRQLFPSEEAEQTNPLRADVWVELPSSDTVWPFDKTPGLEVFVVYVRVKESPGIRGRITRMVAAAKAGSTASGSMIEALQQNLKGLGPCDPKSSSELSRSAAGATPVDVTTYRYQARDGKSLLLYQLVQHRAE